MTGGDVVTPADEATARRLDSRIRLMAGTVRAGLEKIAALVEQAQAGQIHLTLGFHSWTAYLADALGSEHFDAPTPAPSLDHGPLTG